MTQGMYHKYIVLKANGTPVDPEAKYFVLRYDKNSKDTEAASILSIYADRTGNYELKEELRKILAEPKEQK